MRILLHDKFNLLLYTDFCIHSQSMHIGYNNETPNALLEKFSLCSENHKEHTNKI